MPQPHHEFQPHAIKCKIEKKLSKTRIRSKERIFWRREASGRARAKETERALIKFENLFALVRGFRFVVDVKLLLSLCSLFRLVHTSRIFSMQFVCHFKMLRLYVCCLAPTIECRYSFSSIGKLANVYTNTMQNATNISETNDELVVMQRLA